MQAPTIGWGYNYSSTCTIGLTLTQVLRSTCWAYILQLTLTTVGPLNSCMPKSLLLMNVTEVAAENRHIYAATAAAAKRNTRKDLLMS